MASSFVGPQLVKVDINPPVMLLVTYTPVPMEGNDIVVFGLALRYPPSADEMIATNVRLVQYIKLTGCGLVRVEGDEAGIRAVFDATINEEFSANVQDESCSGIFKIFYLVTNETGATSSNHHERAENWCTSR